MDRNQKSLTMKAVLWSQGVYETDLEYFVIDGVSSRYSGSQEQDESLVMMNTTQFVLMKKHCDHEKTSPSFLVKKSKDWLYVEGNFNEKDPAERLRVFRFAIRSKNADEVISTLESYAQQMGCTVRQSDLEELRKLCNYRFFFHNINKTKIITICVIIVITAVICLLWRASVHPKEKEIICGLTEGLY